MPVPSDHPRHRAIRERRVRGRIESALSAVAGWLVTSEEDGRPDSHPLFRDELDEIVHPLDTAEAAVSRTMGPGGELEPEPIEPVPPRTTALSVAGACHGICSRCVINCPPLSIPHRNTGGLGTADGNRRGASGTWPRQYRHEARL